MADIFISYKSERRAAAQHLARVLELHGYSVWFDYGLYSGRDFGRQIERELQAARAVLVLWCPLSVQSEWVFAEAYKAKDMDKLIPARMAPADIPVPFNVADTIDLESWDGAPRSHRLDRLLGEIARLTGREPVPAFNGLRAYDEQWRGLGALSLARLPLSAKVQETEAAAPIDHDMLARLRAQAEALEKAATARQQAEAERIALEARIAAARAQESKAQAAEAQAAQAQPPPLPGLGQKQVEEPAEPGIDFKAWMRRYQRFLVPAGVAAMVLVGPLLLWRPWASDRQRGNGEDPTAVVEAAAASFETKAAPAPQKLSTSNSATLGSRLNQIQSEEEAWKVTKDSGDVAAVRGFIDRFPNGTHASTARAELVRLDGVAWGAALDREGPGLSAYLSKFPNGKYALEARQLDSIVRSGSPVIMQRSSSACESPSHVTTVYFAWDQSDLNQNALDKIDATVAAIRKWENQGGRLVAVRVRGFTDRSGSAVYNLNLSKREASIIRDALVARGLVAESIQTEAWGEANPTRATADGVVEPINRRAEIELCLQ